ncbi:MAG TPA: hydrogenase nickel incorporation protein HypB [Candidatus Kapabacteria bacterium]|nr:hydrogenase nickel incorporation protein HypB [Candidatus Kapabacteria bacterium]
MIKKQVEISARERNDLIGAENRKLFYERGIYAVNIIGSPGCGKTSILEYTVNHFNEKFAVIVGDVKTALDSDRIIQAGNINAYAIETGGGCHLTAHMIKEKVQQMDTSAIDYLFIENVGNLVCPSSFDLGEHLKIAVLSIPEGDEKVRKYPALFLRAAVVLINKVDLLGFMDYDIERVKEDCRTHNSKVKIFETSVKTGQGLDAFFDYLREQRRHF